LGDNPTNLTTEETQKRRGGVITDEKLTTRWGDGFLSPIFPWLSKQNREALGGKRSLNKNKVDIQAGEQG